MRAGGYYHRHFAQSRLYVAYSPTGATLASCFAYNQRQARQEFRRRGIKPYAVARDDASVKFQTPNPND